MSDTPAPAPADNAPNPAPVPEPSPAPVASWRDTLPDDLKSNTSLGKFETVEGLAKSYTNLEKMLGADKVVVPKDGDQEGWNRFYRAAGHPEKAEDYGFGKPEQIPEGMVYDPELDKRLAGIVHKHGLNKHQAAGVRNDLLAMVGEGATANLESSKLAEAENQKAIIAGENALKAEWGNAYEQRGKVAGAAINKFLSPETVAAFAAAGIANNPAVIKDFYNLGVKLAGETELIGAGQTEQTPGDLDGAIADFRTKHGSALYDKSHPDHTVRVKEFTALYQKRFPG